MKKRKYSFYYEGKGKDFKTSVFFFFFVSMGLLLVWLKTKFICKFKIDLFNMTLLKFCCLILILKKLSLKCVF